MKFTDRMPVFQPQGHSEPAWPGDRPSALRAQARRLKTWLAVKSGRRGPKPANARDMNFRWIWSLGTTRGNFRNLHWARPAQNNYRWLLVHNADGTVHCRKMTARELARPAEKWGDEGVANWRRTDDPHSARPLTYGELAKVGAAEDIYVVAEFKTVGCGTPTACRQFVAEAKAAGHPPWAKALAWLPGARQKCEGLIDAGGQFALIFGGRPPRKPKDFAAWRHMPTRVWGPKRTWNWNHR